MCTFHNRSLVHVVVVLEIPEKEIALNLVSRTRRVRDGGDGGGAHIFPYRLPVSVNPVCEVHEQAKQITIMGALRRRRDRGLR